MAKCIHGVMGPFNGKVGTVVGYLWNGKPCMRAYNNIVKNPRTQAQMEHRSMFKQEVQLAAKMRWAVGTTMRDAAREAGLTAYNLFVKVNQPAFGIADGRLTVDYSSLIFSMGDVPQVEMREMEWTADNVLNVRYAMGRGSSVDHVYLYVYVPDLDAGFLAAPTYRYDKRISVSLPDNYAGHNAHVYLMVNSSDDRWSDSLYVGELALNEQVVPEEEPLDLQPDTPSVAPVVEETTAAEAQPASLADRPPDDTSGPRGGLQYSMF